jgi:hypothetical protein
MFNLTGTSFILSRLYLTLRTRRAYSSIKPYATTGMPLWRDRLLTMVAKNAQDDFSIPQDRAVELGEELVRTIDGTSIWEGAVGRRRIGGRLLRVGLNGATTIR